MKTLKPADVDVSFGQFRRERALVSCMANTRPYISSTANRAAQVTEKTYGASKGKELNKGVRMVTNTAYILLRFEKLNFATVHLRVYADSSFATNDDLSSQLGYIVLLWDGEDQRHLLDYASRRSKRVIRSIMGGETYAFMDAFDMEYAIRNNFSEILGMHLGLLMMSDSKYLFDAVTYGKRTAERRFSIYITGACQSQKAYEIEIIGLICEYVNPSDALTKVGGNYLLWRIIESRVDQTPVE